MEALTLSPAAVGGLAIAIPFVAVFLVNGVKGLFYFKAPVRWQAWLPDKYVWAGLAGVFCSVLTVVFNVDVGQAVLGSDWPAWFPWWLGCVLSGIALAALSAKVIYPLFIAPPQKMKALAAVQKHIAETPVVPCPVPEVPYPPLPDPVEEPYVESPPASSPARWYVCLALDEWIVQDTAPKYLLVKTDAPTQVL